MLPARLAGVTGHPNGMKIIQPGVAAIKSRLRRVTGQRIINPERVASIHTYCSPHSIAYRFNFATNPETKSRDDARFLRRPQRQDWRMISSTSALESPPPKVKVPVKNRQPSRARPSRSRAMNSSRAACRSDRSSQRDENHSARRCRDQIAATPGHRSKNHQP